MFNVEISENCKKQFINLEKKAKLGNLNKSEMIFLKRFCRCIFKMIENPYNSILRTSILYSAKSFLKQIDTGKENCYHSYLENHSGVTRRVFWYPESEDTVKIVGVFNHLKSVNSSIKFQSLKF